MPPARSKAEDVFSRLRRDILSGRIAPGQRLRYGELCEAYGTSMGVLRESLLRLAEQGLAKGEPQQGFQVTPLSADDLSELTAARQDIECLVLRHAIEEGGLDWESQLIATHHRLSRTPQLDPDDAQLFNEEWADAHHAFHAMLLDGCANQRLKRIAQGLRDAAELYRRWSLPLGHDGDRDTAGEHAAILEATLARDADQAAARLRAHIRRTTDALLSSPAATPGLQRSR
jgi:DNA-binding GntR family transcriptional regulator